MFPDISAFSQIKEQFSVKYLNVLHFILELKLHWLGFTKISGLHKKYNFISVDRIMPLETLE